MSEIESVSLAADLEPAVAEREITQAVGVRRKLALRYVSRLRRRNPDATPAEMVDMLERHYVTAITVAGGFMTAGTIAANVGVSLIPGGAVGKEAGKGAAKSAAKKLTKAAAQAAAKKAAKGVALGAAKTSAQRFVQLIPAGDEQLQFELTAIFALAMAEIHDMRLDRDQAHALVYGISNGRVSQQQIATMASDVAGASNQVVGVGTAISSGREDWGHWANTLADTLPGGAAQDLVRTIQTGQLETVRSGLDEKQQNAVEYGVGALTGGVTRFVFGRDVVEASRLAFAEPPGDFPEHLSDSAVATPDDDDEPNRAIVALEDAAKSTGAWVASAADKSTRAFRSIDLDGDGVPDEPRARTAIKKASGSAKGAAARGVQKFRSVDLDGDGVPDEPQALTAVKDARGAVTSRIRRRQTQETPPDDDPVQGDSAPGGT